MKDSGTVSDFKALPRDISKLRALNVGCGPLRMEDAVGIDWDTDSAADVNHDLNRFPWPFEDSRFDRVILSHVLEHLKDPDLAVREAHRICRAGGTVTVVTPHYSSYESYGDITHLYHFGLMTFKPYYAPSPVTPVGPGRTKDKSRPLFKLLSRKLYFGSSPLRWPGRLLCAVSFDLYEKYFAFLFSGRNMEFVFEVLK